ncbi:MAG: STAS domain-containing protein [Candidatus Cryptobacteroides sp.]
METIINRNDRNVEIRIVGRVDTIASPQFEQSLAPILEEKGLDVVMDCSGMEYISSSGLRVFLTLQKSLARNGGSLTISSMNEDIREIFDMTGFSSIFTIK